MGTMELLETGHGGLAPVALEGEVGMLHCSTAAGVRGCGGGVGGGRTLARSCRGSIRRVGARWGGVGVWIGHRGGVWRVWGIFS